MWGPAQFIVSLTGCLQLIAHCDTCPWFSSFDWDKFKSLEMEPPYKPEVKSKTDITNFDASDADKPKQIEYHIRGLC